MSFTQFHLFFDDLKVDQEWESLGRTVTEADLVNFAGLSGDFNPIHMDAEFAATTPFRQRIAHGILIFSLGSGLALFSPAVRTLAFKSLIDWQFKEPVFIGDTVRLHSRVLNVESRARGRRGIVTWHRQILNQHRKIVQEGRTQTLVQGRAAQDSTECDKDDLPKRTLQLAAQP